MLTAIEVFLDDLLVHHETMLVHHKLKNIDDTAFLLLIVTDLTHSNRMNLVQHRHEQLIKHPIAKVTLDDNLIDLFLLGDDCKFLECLF